MNKFLITILIPSIEMELNIYIPNNRKMYTIKKKLLSAVYELSEYTFLKSPEEVKFIDRESGIEYANDMYIKDIGIKNGSKIVII